MNRMIRAAVLAGLMGAAMAASTSSVVLAAGGGGAIRVTVNDTAITSGDIAKRVAFLKLQRQGGNLQATAREQLIEETLKRAEVARVGMSVSTQDVDAAFLRFAQSNKLSAAQLNTILDKAGVTTAHFKAYIAVQMSWPRVVNLRYNLGSNRMSGADLVKRMQENGGKKPVTTEYFLQQVIFVVPEKRRGQILGKRQAEAKASRANFPGCEQAKVFAATMHDVSIRSLGRVLEQELPDDWKPLVLKAGDGITTDTRVTERGVEYLAICKKRQVNDDVAAEIVFRAEDLGKKKDGGAEDANSKRYLDELRKRAQIVTR
ncbi:periplasmic chaperone for outer membrane proteins SurA [Rhizobium sp. RU20A]|uniref:SurA N-terminal domain-containing protein n=1 Tax=Rhizobium sp. RU20A TaxID=1907412 RepID=UPI000956576F|nr:SurA N-terminal domain-containing protein [Rhizobium sp. RU20A]SIP93712.1 periplasmic chaperone for outer membrane proteins SurA [Rhizobium sp. RU20A]